METLTEAVATALEKADPVESAHEVKHVVCTQLQQADPQVTPRMTNYFNNTFTPDIIASWPDGSERQVFLRTTGNVDWLRSDLQYVPLGSMMLPIGHIERASEGPSSAVDSMDDLDQEARAREALVTDLDAVDDMAGAMRKNRSAGLFVASMLRGGRGFVPERLGASAIARAAAGFEGAQSGDAELTAGAISTFEDFLSLEEDERLTDVLKALWLGGGESASTFPASRASATPDLDIQTLRYLLDQGELWEENFWPRIARRVSLATIQSLGDYGPTSGLTSLLKASAKYFRTASCFVEKVSSDAPGLPIWNVESSSLRLTSRSFSAWVPSDRARSADDEKVLTPRAAGQRFLKSGRPVTEMSVHLVNDRRVRIISELETGLDLTEPDAFGVNADGAPSVDMVKVVLPSDTIWQLTPASGLGKTPARGSARLPEAIRETAIWIANPGTEELATLNALILGPEDNSCDTSDMDD